MDSGAMKATLHDPGDRWRRPLWQKLGRIAVWLVASAFLGSVWVCTSTISTPNSSPSSPSSPHRGSFSIPATPSVNHAHHLLSGNLTLPHLPSLPNCVNVQLRGVETLLTPTQARAQLADLSHHDQDRGPIPTGIVTVEDPNRFVSLSKGYFHFFHFLEFVVIAFAEMVPMGRWNLASSREETILDVQWWYSPLLTPEEICGSAKGMNCLLLRLLWPSVQAVYGLDANTPEMQTWHEAYRGILEKRTKVGASFEPDGRQVLRHKAMSDKVDVLLLIDRARCVQQQSVPIHKIWTNYVGKFPYHAWYDQLSHSLDLQKHIQSSTESYSSSLSSSYPSSPSPSPLKVGYIDRQATNRRIPDSFHDWLIEYLRHHKDVDFLHVRMQHYPAAAQILMARQLDMIVGVHGNGLSHQFWMRPNSFVMEFYWNFGFHYDYPSAAMLMNHTYRGLFNGNPLDEKRIAARDSTMLQCCTDRKSLWNESASRAAVVDFVQQALQQRQRPRL